jgi:hypothetical protein
MSVKDHVGAHGSKVGWSLEKIQWTPWPRVSLAVEAPR